MNHLERLTAKELKRRFFQMETAEDVAALLGADSQFLRYILYVAPPERKYRRFSIPKRSGGKRQILAPSLPLKQLQWTLEMFLQAVYSPPDAVHGFIPGRSILTNAQMHTGQTYVFNLDLKDFFPSINFGRVRGLFMAHPYRLPGPVATILAQICCHNNQLPQGAPTSPVISNMICARLDNDLQRLGQREGWSYTRYADDLTFSTSIPSLSGAIVSRTYRKAKVESIVIEENGKLILDLDEPDTNHGGEVIVEPGYELHRIIDDNGFEVNEEKVRLLIKTQHQEVTGLTVNRFPNVHRTFIRQIRAMLHAWRKFGLEAASREHFEKYRHDEPAPHKQKASFKQVVRGKIDFVGMVRGRGDEIYIKLWNQLVDLASDIGAPIVQDDAPESERSLVHATGISSKNQFRDWVDRLPFPLASILWTYHVADTQKEKYEHLLDFFEALAQFYATVLLSGFRSDAEKLDEIRSFISDQALSLERSTFGDWSRLFEFSAKRLRALWNSGQSRSQCTEMFGTEDAEVYRMLTSKGLAHVLQQTNSRRNDWKGHGGIPSVDEAKRRHEELLSYLEDTHKIVGSTWQKYFLICPGNSVYEDERYKYTVMRAVGSRTPFERSEVSVVNPMENKRLYLYSPDTERALQVLPFVRIMPAPKSEQTACYFYNRVERERVRFVSYHFRTEADIAKPFPRTREALSLLQKN